MKPARPLLEGTHYQRDFALIVGVLFVLTSVFLVMMVAK